MIGSIIMHGKAAVPNGFLLCNGQSVLRADYPDLFAIIGTTYGSADGTHFNVPDLKGKVIFGYKSADSDFNALGKTGGSKTANFAHSHTMNTHTHAYASGNAAATTSGSVNKSSGAQVDSTPPSHTHTISTITCGNQSDAGTNSQLNSGQSLMSKFVVCYPLIKT